MFEELSKCEDFEEEILQAFVYKHIRNDWQITDRWDNQMIDINRQSLVKKANNIQKLNPSLLFTVKLPQHFEFPHFNMVTWKELKFLVTLWYRN